MRIQTRKKLIATVTLWLLTLQSFPLVAFGATTNDILQAIIANEKAKSEEQKKVLKYIGEKTGFTRGINNFIANEKAKSEEQKKLFKYIGEKTGFTRGINNLIANEKANWEKQKRYLNTLVKKPV